MPQDLYTSWLGVSSGPRPPDHYTLLGIPRFCHDQDDIEQAVRHRMDKLDQYALHPDRAKRDTCQNMMNELAGARVQLVNLDTKRRYDRELAAKLGVKEPERAQLPKGPEPSRKESPRQVFEKRLRAHVLKWALNPHEERLLVAEAAAVGIREAEALRIIHRIDAEAEKVTRKWNRKIMALIVAAVVVTFVAIYFFLILPAMRRAKVEQQFESHIADARKLIRENKFALALAALERAGALKPDETVLRDLRRDARYGTHLSVAANCIREGTYGKAAEQIELAMKVDPNRGDAGQLRRQTLARLARRINGHLAAKEPTPALAVLKHVQALAEDDPLIKTLTEQIRAVQRQLVLDEVPRDLARGNYAAARAKIDVLKRLGGKAEQVERLFQEHARKLQAQFRARFAAADWAGASKIAESLRLLDTAAKRQWNFVALFGPEAQAASQPAASPGFAEKMLTAAQDPKLTPYPDLQAMLCSAAYEYGIKAPRGYPAALKAAEQLQTLTRDPLAQIRQMQLAVHRAAVSAAGTAEVKARRQKILFCFLYAELGQTDAARKILDQMQDLTGSQILDQTGKEPKDLTPQQRKRIAEWHRSRVLTEGLSRIGRDNLLRIANTYEPPPAVAEPQAGATAKPDVSLGDLTWVSAKTATDAKYPATTDWVCEQYPAIKRPLAIRKRTYEKGLSVWAPAEVVYELKGAYRVFLAEVGLDNQAQRRNPKNAGSIVAEVWIDAEKVYTSPILGPQDQAQTVKVAIPAGRKQIKLVALAAGKKTRRITTWGNAGFMVSTEAATVSSTKSDPSDKQPPAPEVPLADLQAARATSGWGAVTPNASPYEKQPLKIKEQAFAKGLGLHANSRLVYDLKADYTAFVGGIGVHSHGIKGPRGTVGGSVAVEVFIDNTRVRRSPVIRYGGGPYWIRVPISAGSKQLTLITTHGADTSNPDLADWVHVGFVTGKEPVVRPPAPEPPVPVTAPEAQVIKQINKALKAGQYTAARDAADAYRKAHGPSKKIDQAIAAWNATTSTQFLAHVAKAKPANFAKALQFAQAIRDVNSADGTYDVNLLFGLEGQSAKAAAATSLGFARKLLTVAKGLAADEALAAALRNAAYDYALAHPENEEEAKKLFKELARAYQHEYRAKLLPIYRRQYAKSTDNQKVSKGLEFLDAMLAAAEAFIQTAKWAEAAALYKEAGPLAAAVGAAKTDYIQTRIQLVQSRQEYVTEAKRLEAVLESKPPNAGETRDKLAHLYYVELWNVARAAVHARGADAEALQLAQKPLADLSIDECQTLSAWHEALVKRGGISSEARTRLAAQARKYDERRRKILASPPLRLTALSKGSIAIKGARTVPTALALSGRNQTLALTGDTLIVGTIRPVNFFVGVLPAGAPVVNVNLSGLNDLHVNGLELCVGRGRRPPADAEKKTQGIAVLVLARATSIRTKTVVVGHCTGSGSTGMTGTLELSGNTKLFVGALEIGKGPAAEGTVRFAAGKPGRLVLRGHSGGDSRTNVILGSLATGTQGVGAAVLDLSAGTVDARIDTLETVKGGTNTTAKLLVGQGAVDVNRMILRRGTEAVFEDTQVRINGTLTIEDGATLTLYFKRDVKPDVQTWLEIPDTPANRALLGKYTKDKSILLLSKTPPAPTVTIIPVGRHLRVQVKP